MANRNSVTGLLSQLSRSSSGTALRGGSTTVTNLVVPLSSGGSSSRALTLGRSSETRATGLNDRILPTSIQFGSPSSTRTTSSTTTGTGWSKLLTQTASGGLASALGGGLGSIGGLGSLVSGIVGLFSGGSKSSLPALERFQLSASQAETVYVSSKTISGQDAAMSQTTSKNGGGIYGSGGGQTSKASNPSYDAGQIAQAVKQALLNSSSLNDIIAEI